MGGAGLGNCVPVVEAGPDMRAVTRTAWLGVPLTIRVLSSHPQKQHSQRARLRLWNQTS